MRPLAKRVIKFFASGPYDRLNSREDLLSLKPAPLSVAEPSRLPDRLFGLKPNFRLLPENRTLP